MDGIRYSMMNISHHKKGIRDILRIRYKEKRFLSDGGEHMEQISKKGLFTACGSYIIWGLLPLYWALLHHISPYSVLAHRIIWSGVFMIFVAVLFNYKQFLKDCLHLWSHKSQIVLLIIAAIMIGANWGLYIWAIANDMIMDTSLGYYINPLLNVLVGVFLFKEKLTSIQWFSVLIAAIGIIYLTVQMGSLPMVSLLLAITFCLYGTTKKKLTIHPFTSIAFEAWIVTPVALWYTSSIDPISWTYFPDFSVTASLFVLSGLTTSIPLVLFSYGARLLPLNLLGFLQYLSPTIALLLAIFHFGEHFTHAKIVAFSCIWAALIMFTISNWTSGKKIK